MNLSIEICSFSKSNSHLVSNSENIFSDFKAKARRNTRHNRKLSSLFNTTENLWKLNVWMRDKTSSWSSRDIPWFRLILLTKEIICFENRFNRVSNISSIGNFNNSTLHGGIQKSFRDGLVLLLPDILCGNWDGRHVRIPLYMLFLPDSCDSPSYVCSSEKEPEAYSHRKDSQCGPYRSRFYQYICMRPLLWWLQAIIVILMLLFLYIKELILTSLQLLG